MKINLSSNSITTAKATLRKAEDLYTKLLEGAIKAHIDPIKSKNSYKLNALVQKKTGLASEYIMDMGVWAIQEQFIKKYHYLEKLIDLLNSPINHHSEWEGVDDTRELEILRGIHSELDNVN